MSFRPATLTDVGQRWHIYSPLASTVVVTGEGPVTVPAGHVLVVFGFTADGIDAIWVQGELQSGLPAPASPYTPADSANWTGADPTTIAEAIDRIAAALGPIA